MSEDQVQIAIPASPDAVWAVAGDFAGVDTFLTGIDSLTIEGDDRIIEMFGMKIREHLVERDDAARSLTYSVVDGVPIERHRATVAVAADGDASMVTWSFDVAPDEMAPIFADTYRQGLEALRAHFS